MTEPVIALVFDFDETLGPDTISFFLETQGLNVNSFWEEIDEMVKDGWDPPLAYMNRLLELYYKEGKVDLSKDAFEKAGKKLKLFPGLPQAFQELKDFVGNSTELKGKDLSLEFYIISGGFEEMIRATQIAPFMTGIFGCNFAYDKNRVPIGPKSTITFTEKTRFLHGIKKGIGVDDLRNSPYRINDFVPSNEQRLSFSHMIYIGDGPSDIPCLSTIVNNGGTAIGVSAPFGSFKKGYELARGKRITVGPYTANYKKGSDMRKVLEETILRVGLEIDVEKKSGIVRAPGH